MKNRYYMQTTDGEVFSTANPEYHKDCTQLSHKYGAARYKEQTRQKLREILKPGQTVYTVLRHVSSSGMSRRISLYTIADGALRWLDNYALALGVGDAPRGNQQGIRVNGCGMDMGFSLVYNLGWAIWPDGTPEPHSSRNGHPDKTGEYALRHEWI